MAKVSVYIIAYNEELKIKEAIESVLWADEIIVADSASKDNTVAIAEQLGAKVVQVPFNGFGNLRNEAIKHCQHEWVFSLDSDERCTEEAKAEILSIVKADENIDHNMQEPEHDIYFMPRKNMFLGKWLKHIYHYPDYRQPQLFRNGYMTYKGSDDVHEGFIANTNKSIGYLKNSIWQIPYISLEEMINKANRYSTLGVSKLEAKNFKPTMRKAFGHATWSFFKLYILHRGFLDGWRGFIIAFYNFEYTFYRYAKFFYKKEAITKDQQKKHKHKY